MTLQILLEAVVERISTQDDQYMNICEWLHDYRKLCLIRFCKDWFQ